MKLADLLEAAVDVAKKGLGLSLTKIKTYETCKYRYYLQYITNEKIDKKDYNPKFFKLGQFAHKWIESKIANKECKFNSTTLTAEDKEKTIKSCDNVFNNEYVKGLLSKGGVSEKGFSLYITPTEPDGLEASDSYSKFADFAGYIDFYVKDGATVHIIDWKTGGIKGSDDDTFLQLLLYAKAIQKLEGGTHFVLSYFYIDHNKLDKREFGLDELNSKIEKIVTKGIEIPTQQDRTLFPPSPGAICKTCPYAKIVKDDGSAVCEFSS